MAEPNWANRTLYHEDNLKVLRGMDTGTVRLIATDPPFNKGKDFHATPDSLAAGASFHDRWSWKRDVHGDWVDQLEDDWPGAWSVIQGSRDSWGDDMGAFLCFMAVRLLEMHRVLRDDGAIYLHCDTTASHYLKALMDAIFGHDNFRNSISWQRNDGRGKGSQHKPKQWGRNTDTLLFYAKTKATTLRPYQTLSPELVEIEFPKVDMDGRRYKTGIPIFCSKSMGVRPNLCFVWRGFRNPYPSGWRLSKKRLEEEYQRGNVVIREDGKLERRKYEDEYDGTPVDDFWGDIPRIAKGGEATGYPTQKPLALYERIIRASSDPGDMVLDPFCGCATTCVAAEKLGRAWVGIDIWDDAHAVTIDRLKKEGCLTGPDGSSPNLITIRGRIKYEPKPPKRRDDGEYAAPYLKTVKHIQKEPGPKMSRAQMMRILIDNEGLICQGCYRTFDDPRYLELDHSRPRSDGGGNHIDNRILLCGPCNRQKSNTLTLSGLRVYNKKHGHMQKAPAGPPPKPKQRVLASYG